MSIIVLGTVALDTVKTPSGSRTRMLGGSAAHFSLAARFFTKVSLVAVIGRDFPGAHLDFLNQRGIDISSVKTQEGVSFQWKGSYEGDLNTAETLHTELGVLATFAPEISRQQRNIKHVFLANVDPDIQYSMFRTMRSPQLVGLDSMNYWIQQKRKSLLRMLKKADIYLANDQEAKSLSGENNLVLAASCLRRLGPRIVIIKKGEHGVLFSSGGLAFALPGYPLCRVVDPTGAGDSFAGGFMGYLAARGKIDARTLKKAAAFGTAIASCNVEGFGVEKVAGLTQKKLQARLEDYRRMVAL